MGFMPVSIQFGQSQFGVAVQIDGLQPRTASNQRTCAVFLSLCHTLRPSLASSRPDRFEFGRHGTLTHARDVGLDHPYDVINHNRATPRFAHALPAVVKLRSRTLGAWITSRMLLERLLQDAFLFDQGDVDLSRNIRYSSSDASRSPDTHRYEGAYRQTVGSPPISAMGLSLAGAISSSLASSNAGSMSLPSEPPRERSCPHKQSNARLVVPIFTDLAFSRRCLALCDRA